MSLPARLNCEVLELRECPATVSLFNRVLTVTGTDGPDVISVTSSGNWIWAEGGRFSAKSVSRVVITGLGGDDVITDATTRGSVIYGGMGDDTVSAGAGADTVYGGQGDDTIDGGDGNDTVYGGSGDDNLTDPSGTNSLWQESPQRLQSNTNLEASIVRLVNDFRAQNGLGPLTISQRLNAAAELHTVDMVAISNAYGPSRALQHTLVGTIRPQIPDRFDAVGYDQWTRAFRYGENIAYGFRTAVDVVNAWMNSPGHRANILDPAFTEIGVFAKSDSAGRIFITQSFGMLA